VSAHSELVIAHRSEGRAIADSENPRWGRRGMVWPVDEIPLCSLWLILEGKEPLVDDVVARAKAFEQLAEVSQEGPWVVRVPDAVRDLVADLSAADEEKLRAVALALASTPEMDGWDIAEVQGLVRQVVGLAKEARQHGLDLILRICLW
jgi:hypothetical protein